LDAKKITAKDAVRTTTRIIAVNIFLNFLENSDSFLFSQIISEGSEAGLTVILPPKKCFNS
jgi:hypothetical protein